MLSLYRDQGVVLRTIKLGEADRIVTIFTQGHGKVRAVAKGIRKTAQPLRCPARAHEPRRAPVLQGPGARRRHPGRDDRREPAAARGLRRRSPTRSPCWRRSTRWPRSASRNTALYRMLVGALRALAPSTQSPAGDAGVLLEAAVARGVPPACSRAAPAAATRTARSRRSTSATAGCCARRAAGWAGAGSTRRRSSCSGGSSVASCGGALARQPDRAASEVEHLGVAALEYHLERRLRSARLLEPA